MASDITTKQLPLSLITNKTYNREEWNCAVRFAEKKGIPPTPEGKTPEEWKIEYVQKKDLEDCKNRKNRHDPRMNTTTMRSYDDEAWDEIRAMGFCRAIGGLIL